MDNDFKKVVLIFHRNHLAFLYDGVCVLVAVTVVVDDDHIIKVDVVTHEFVHVAVVDDDAHDFVHVAIVDVDNTLVVLVVDSTVIVTPSQIERNE